jgi:uncharacterized protein (TIGR02145 family)
MISYLASQGFPKSNVPDGAGNALKSCRQVNSPLEGDCNTADHPRWSSHSTHYGNDQYGFSALPGGGRWINGSYYYAGDYGHWWSSTEYGSSGAWSYGIHYLHGNIGQIGVDKSYGYSVRCVRDN